MRLRSVRAMLAMLAVATQAGSARAQQPVPGPDGEIYAAVLRFFSPPGGQLRWLDPALLPGGEAPARLDEPTVRYLLGELGPRFARLEAEPGGSARGGVVRLSAIRRFAPDSAEVRAHYRHVSPYAEPPASELTFTVTRRNGRWRATHR
jgi:hypothetical protein